MCATLPSITVIIRLFPAGPERSEAPLLLLECRKVNYQYSSHAMTNLHEVSSSLGGQFISSGMRTADISGFTSKEAESMMHVCCLGLYLRHPVSTGRQVQLSHKTVLISCTGCKVITHSVCSLPSTSKQLEVCVCEIQSTAVVKQHRKI